MCVREGASAPRWRSGGGCGGGKILQSFPGVSGSSFSVIWTTSSSPTSRPARARRRRLCADEDACQHSRCDNSSGSAGSWEWKLLLQGVAEASLYPMLVLMVEPRAPLLQALPSLEQAAQLVTLEGVVRPGEPGGHGRSSGDSSVKLIAGGLGGHSRGAKVSLQGLWGQLSGRTWDCCPAGSWQTQALSRLRARLRR
jgi:hypothetical protein